MEKMRGRNGLILIHQTQMEETLNCIATINMDASIQVLSKRDQLKEQRPIKLDK
ncbi:hypothetical protein BpHYR1_025876 [Brachionus plicatilis]|uniref:Uncharacterized protein n=1 Tax=Brachionus plicatilis TaxID=10195 RepID=A0A3M7P3L1_BRAPC|nr:hypothetical protein BpHYR1_025876 [Brachionus plicatilis]